MRPRDSHAADGQHAEKGPASAAGLCGGRPPGPQLFTVPESGTLQHGCLGGTEQGEAELDGRHL